MEKILVIDDDVTTRRVLLNILEQRGYSVIQSSNGKHGWETLWENPDIRLIITDMMMPDMDGRELIQIVRGNQAVAAIPILVVSGVSVANDVNDLLRLGKVRFLAKPVTITTLIQNVDALVQEVGSYTEQ